MFPSFLFQSALALTGAACLSAATLTMTVPTGVTADADGDSAAPWNCNGTTALVLRFDSRGNLPANATVTSATIRVQGAAIGASYRSEIDIQIATPSGQAMAWDLGSLGQPNSTGSYDTGNLTVPAGGSAAGEFVVTFTEDYNDSGNDNRVDSVTLVINYESTSVFGNPMGAYLNGKFPATPPAVGSVAGLPATLSATNAFTSLAELSPVEGLLPYGVNSPLWTDGAAKRRWIAVPGDGNRDTAAEKVNFRIDQPWTFPAGTVAVKHFEIETIAGNPSSVKRMETRFLVATGNNSFYGVTYRWRADGSEADLLPDGASGNYNYTDATGTTSSRTWDFPSRTDCMSCHNQGAGVFLGLNTWQLNGDYSYDNSSSPQNQLTAWSGAGLFDVSIGNPSSLPAAVAVDDASASLEHRVRSYLAANCANCHNEESVSDLNAQLDLLYPTALADTGLINGVPLYDLGIDGARVIKPRSPEESVLYHRVNTEGIHRMPPIGRHVIDEAAVDTLRAWILSLSDGSGTANNPPIANNDDALTLAGQAVMIAVFSNDVDVDGDSFSLLQATNPAHGTLVWSATGVTYTPSTGYTGTDSFRYQIRDTGGNVSGEAEVTILIRPAAVANTVNYTNSSDLLADSTAASGVAMGVVDMNGDGRDDIVRLRSAKTLFIEYQPATAGTAFTKREIGSAGSTNQWGMAVGDADNNGFPDVVVGGYYDGLKYYRANATGTGYSKTTLGTPSIFLQAANFADINGDGWLDIFACHDDGNNADFRNSGNGTMVYDDSLIETRTVPTSDNSGNYGTVWTDYDGDGDVDLYIAKCRGGVSSSTDPRRINQLFRNNGNGTYTEVGAAAGLADGSQSWTADFADIDNDGDLDCFIGNHASASKMMRNNGNGTFSNITSASGVGVTWKVIQSVFRDFNNDGWIDLLLTGESHELWLNDGDGTFTETANPFTSAAIESAAVGDLNHDGFPDVFGGYAQLYNTPQTSKPDKLFLSTPNGNNFLSISLEGRSSNRLASGARLELHGPWGVQVREVRSGEGYGVTHSFSQRFGLGNAATADKLVVRWPSGAVDTAFNISANQFLTLKEGDTRAPELTSPGNQVTGGSTAVSLQIQASDFHGNALTFSAINLPTGLSINSATGRITGTTSTAGGTFNAVVSVTDGWSTVSRNFTWTVQAPANTAPLLAQPGNQTTTVGQAVTLRLIGSDADGDALTYSASGLPSGLSLASATGIISGTANLVGVYQVSASVSDGRASASRQFAWTISNLPNTPPVLVSPGNQTSVAGQSVALSLSASDGDGDSLTFSATGLPQGLAIHATTGAISGTPGVAGSFAVILTVSDGAATDSREILWTVNPVVTSLAYGGTPPVLPTRIEAENFDTGGAGVSYYDNEPTNVGEFYRNTGVDLESSFDTDGTASLGWADDGEWLNYTVQLTPGTWDIVARAASAYAAPGSLRVSLDGEPLGVIDIAGTGDWYIWQEFTLPSIQINGTGTGVLRLEIQGASFNLNWIEFRTPSGDGGGNEEVQTPFNGLSASIPGRIEAENFDEGGQGVAYFDVDSGNIGTEYRDSDVDLESSFDVDSGHSIGWIENSEWTEYTVNVTPGTYDISARIASAELAPGAIRFILGGRELGFATVPGTGDWYDWQDVVLPGVSLSESGSAILRLEYVGGPFNLNWVQFTPGEGGGEGGTGQAPFLGVATRLPGRIQAENYDFGGEGIAYHDNEEANLTGVYRNDGVDIEFSNDIDATPSLGWYDNGEWLEYTVAVTPGNYTLAVRTAAGEPNPGDLRVSLNGRQIALVDTPDTGAFNIWETTELTDINITESGMVVLRVEAVGNGINLNWLEFIDQAPAVAPASLLALAFGSWTLEDEELIQPVYKSVVVNGERYPGICFLTRLGGWPTATGYATNDLNYEPQISTNLVNWQASLIREDNFDGSPIPPAGFKYVTYRSTVPLAVDSHQFFRILVENKD